MEGVVNKGALRVIELADRYEVPRPESPLLADGFFAFCPSNLRVPIRRPATSSPPHDALDLGLTTAIMPFLEFQKAIAEKINPGRVSNMPVRNTEKPAESVMRALKPRNRTTGNVKTFGIALVPPDDVPVYKSGPSRFAKAVEPDTDIRYVITGDFRTVGTVACALQVGYTCEDDQFYLYHRTYPISNKAQVIVDLTKPTG